MKNLENAFHIEGEENTSVSPPETCLFGVQLLSAAPPIACYNAGKLGGNRAQPAPIAAMFAADAYQIHTTQFMRMKCSHSHVRATFAPMLTGERLQRVHATT